MKLKRVDEYGLVAEAVMGGIKSGLYRVDKHSDNPLTEDKRTAVQDQVYLGVMHSLNEIIEWEEATDADVDLDLTDVVATPDTRERFGF